MKSVNRGPNDRPARGRERRHQFVGEARFPGRIHTINSKAKRVAAGDISDQAAESVKKLLARRRCHRGNPAPTVFASRFQCR
jgi:hypothetical protein